MLLWIQKTWCIIDILVENVLDRLLWSYIVHKKTETQSVWLVFLSFFFPVQSTCRRLFFLKSNLSADSQNPSYRFVLLLIPFVCFKGHEIGNCLMSGFKKLPSPLIEQGVTETLDRYPCLRMTIMNPITDKWWYFLDLRSWRKVVRLVSSLRWHLCRVCVGWSEGQRFIKCCRCCILVLDQAAAANYSSLYEVLTKS